MTYSLVFLAATCLVADANEGALRPVAAQTEAPQAAATGCGCGCENQGWLQHWLHGLHHKSCGCESASPCASPCRQEARPCAKPCTPCQTKCNPCPKPCQTARQPCQPCAKPCQVTCRPCPKPCPPRNCEPCPPAAAPCTTVSQKPVNDGEIKTE